MKHKIYISDLHIGVGDVNDDFIYDKKLIEILTKYINEDVELYIVGDLLELFDFCDGEELSNSLDEYVKEITEDYIYQIYYAHKEMLDLIKHYANTKKVIYISGNHDYHVFYSDRLKKIVKKILGNVIMVPYYYDEEWEIFIIHGHQFDIVNRLWIDKEGVIKPSFGEYLVRYMKRNFDEKVIEFLSDELIADYNNISPLLDVFNWLDFVKDKYNLSYDLKEYWTKLFVQFIRTPQIKKWIKVNFPKYRFFTDIFVNNVGGMKFGEFIVRIIMFFRRTNKTDNLLKNTNKLINENFFIPKEHLIGQYDNDIEFPKEKIKGLIMGHNHKPSFHMFNNNKVKKFYSNTGSWKHVVEKNYGVNEEEFCRKKNVSYLIINQNTNNKLDIKLHIEQIY